MLDKLVKGLEYLHDKGLPLPLLRDKGEGSVSLTLLVVSFTIVAQAVLQEKNDDSLMYALVLFGMCGSMYWGKKWQIRKIGQFDISGGEDLDKEDKKE